MHKKTPKCSLFVKKHSRGRIFPEPPTEVQAKPPVSSNPANAPGGWSTLLPQTNVRDKDKVCAVDARPSHNLPIEWSCIALWSTVTADGADSV